MPRQLADISQLVRSAAAPFSEFNKQNSPNVLLQEGFSFHLCSEVGSADPSCTPLGVIRAHTYLHASLFFVTPTEHPVTQEIELDCEES